MRRTCLWLLPVAFLGLAPAACGRGDRATSKSNPRYTTGEEGAGRGVPPESGQRVEEPGPSGQSTPKPANP